MLQERSLWHGQVLQTAGLHQAGAQSANKGHRGVERQEHCVPGPCAAALQSSEGLAKIWETDRPQIVKDLAATAACHPSCTAEHLTRVYIFWAAVANPVVCS